MHQQNICDISLSSHFHRLRPRSESDPTLFNPDKFFFSNQNKKRERIHRKKIEKKHREHKQKG